jgi:hypothetical protein
MVKIMQKCGDHEEIYVTQFVRRAMIRLEMIDMTEFRNSKTDKFALSKIKANHVCSSLKSWLLDWSERKQFYHIIRVVQQICETRQLKTLKKLIKEKFNTAERAEMVAMVVAVTQKTKKTTGGYEY